jgi:hypothetical protein
MITTRCLIEFHSHTSHVQVDSRGIIQVFKYTGASCDFEVFTEDQQTQAGDYIMMPLSNLHYYVSIPGEPPPHLAR